ncbi:MAG: LPXTG cell wall anchor domain-containing protein [Acidobacteriota bacterium]|nr:LPXTG cell wall anchor domain-containing protein [Acidobacteriota bacterium]
MLDLRLPSGVFFALLGLILIGLGVISPGMRAPLTEINVNLYAGAGMLLFGGFLLLLARRRS